MTADKEDWKTIKYCYDPLQSGAGIIMIMHRNVKLVTYTFTYFFDNLFFTYKTRKVWRFHFELFMIHTTLRFFGIFHFVRIYYLLIINLIKLMTDKHNYYVFFFILLLLTQASFI